MREGQEGRMLLVGCGKVIAQHARTSLSATHHVPYHACHTSRVTGRRKAPPSIPRSRGGRVGLFCVQSSVAREPTSDAYDFLVATEF